MTNTAAIPYEKAIPDVIKRLSGIHDIIDAHGFDRKIHHLVQLRASQINRCAYCVKMHASEAREDGETSERLDRLVIWEEVGDFATREKAALAWTEALTVLTPSRDLGVLRAQLREHFSEAEIGILTATVAMINLWNRIQISRH